MTKLVYRTLNMTQFFIAIRRVYENKPYNITRCERQIEENENFINLIFLFIDETALMR